MVRTIIGVWFAAVFYAIYFSIPSINHYVKSSVCMASLVISNFVLLTLGMTGSGFFLGSYFLLVYLIARMWTSIKGI